MKNHTGTHVLNYALRTVLPDSDQKGSLVAPDRLRFDFTSKQAMTAAQVKQAEATAQQLIDTKQDVFAKEAPLSKALEIDGLRAMFGEVCLFFSSISEFRPTLILFASFRLERQLKTCSPTPKVSLVDKQRLNSVVERMLL